MSNLSFPSPRPFNSNFGLDEFFTWLDEHTPNQGSNQRPNTQFEKYNQKWLDWNDQNNERIDYLISIFPLIMKANQMEWLSDNNWPYNEDDGELDEFFDLINGAIIAAIRFPEWKKVLNYMSDSDKYDPEIEAILLRIDEELDRTEFTDMEEELFDQLIHQYASYLVD